MIMPLRGFRSFALGVWSGPRKQDPLEDPQEVADLEQQAVGAVIGAEELEVVHELDVAEGEG